MGKQLLNDGVKREVLISGTKIKERVREIAKQISEDYKDKNPIFIGIMRGSFMFLADLSRELDPNLRPEFDFMFISSYLGTESTRQPKIEKDLSTNIEGRHVVVVEDIVDTGTSFKVLLEILSARSPASLKTCALLSKPGRREVVVPIDYLGFEVLDLWVEGYGLDTDQLNRNLPEIWFRE